MLRRHRFLKGLLIACALGCAGLAAPPSGGSAQYVGVLATPEALRERIRSMVTRAGLGEGVGISIVDLATKQTIFEHQARTPLNPASNQKLITAAVALEELGPAHRMRTGLYGQIAADAVVGGLHLRGFGDPTLRAADLVVMAQELAARGVRSVDEVVVDGNFFDDKVLPPAFEQQPNEDAPFRAPVAAVSLDENAYTLRVTPAASAGEPARVQVDGEGYFDLTNTTTTVSGGAPNVIAVQSAKADRLVLKVSGQVPTGIGTLSYRRRVDSPLPYAGYVLVEALKALRIQVPRRVRIATTPGSARLLVSHESAPLAQILSALGKDSDNFVAEMVLKLIAAERVKAPGRSEDGARHVLAVLKRLGVDTANMKVVNGSGLFDGNLVSAAQLTQLLAAVHADHAVRSEYLAQLAVGGVDGTLSQRFDALPTPASVRAKTGTLDDVIALSGYVLGPSPERVMAFSLLANGIQGKQHAARALADQIATELARHLWSAH